MFIFTLLYIVTDRHQKKAFRKIIAAALRNEINDPEPDNIRSL